MLPKPRHLAREFADQFKDPDVAAAYLHRPAYPEDVIVRLIELLPWGKRVVLDLGCGTGEIARQLAGHVDRIDAVDASGAMIFVGQACCNGRHDSLHWCCCPVEDFTYSRKYDLVIAAESFHWFDWAAVVPNIRQALAQQGRLVLLDRDAAQVPWNKALRGVVVKFSTNREFQPYDLVAELQKRRLFEVERSIHTQPRLVRTSVEEYIESLHSRNGLTRARMGSRRSSEFDDEVRRIVAGHVRRGEIEFPVSVSIVWGRPVA